MTKTQPQRCRPSGGTRAGRCRAWALPLQPWPRAWILWRYAKSMICWSVTPTCYSTPAMQALCSVLRSAAWHQSVQALGGHDCTGSGDVSLLHERLPWWSKSSSHHAQDQAQSIDITSVKTLY